LNDPYGGGGIKLTLTIFFPLVLFAFAWSVKAETDGNAWVKQSEEFKRGYSAGQLETQMAWGAALLATPPASNEMKKTLEAIGQVARHTALCVRNKGVSADQLKKLTEDYLRAHPDRANGPIVLTMGEVLAPICERK
jgi:hypothetical protein